METLGSLCDKLTIIKLKQFHCDDSNKLTSLNQQEHGMIEEIDDYIANAYSGLIPINKLTMESNKIYKRDGNKTSDISGDIGELFSSLAEINCKLWHEQEKVYEFEKVPNEEKNNVVKKLAILNLERNNCMDGINLQFKNIVQEKIK